jgi:hypothetical protein
MPSVLKNLRCDQAPNPGQHTPSLAWLRPERELDSAHRFVPHPRHWEKLARLIAAQQKLHSEHGTSGVSGPR